MSAALPQRSCKRCGVPKAANLWNTATGRKLVARPAAKRDEGLAANQVHKTCPQARYCDGGPARVDRNPLVETNEQNVSKAEVGS